MMSLWREHGKMVMVEATRYGSVSMSSCSRNGTKHAKVCRMVNPRAIKSVAHINKQKILNS